MRVAHSIPYTGLGLALLATFGFAGQSKVPQAKQAGQPSLRLTEQFHAEATRASWDDLMAIQAALPPFATQAFEAPTVPLETPQIELPALDSKFRSKLGPAAASSNEALVLCPSLVAEPALDHGFVAQPDVPNGALSSFIPPDVAGDVGPNHVMTTLNNKVHVQDRTGGSMLNLDLSVFWGTGAANPSYPRCHYDAINGRWIATAHVGAGAASTILFAISDTSDPTGLWSFYSFLSDPGAVRFADWVVTGFNSTWVTIASNMFNIAGSTFAGSKMWIIDMATALVPGGPLTISVTPIGWSGTISGFNTSGQFPTKSLDTSDPAMYVMSNPGLSSGGVVALQGFSITGTGPAPVIAALPGSPFGATAGFFLVVNNFSLNQRVMEQLGEPRFITAFSSRMAGALVRNGRVWMTHSAGLPGPATNTALTHTAAFWYEVNPAALPAPIVQSGSIHSGSGSAFTMPSIVVNCGNDALVGFSRGDVTRHPESGYAIRLGTDPLSTMGPIRLLKAGESTYWKNFGVGTTAQWGRYSSSGIDPVDDKTFWTVQEYAAQRVGVADNDSRWGTWWGRIGECGEPTISDDPDSTDVCVGDPASFSVSATASLAPLVYQWRKDGVNIPGATSSTYSIGGTVASDGGVYDVVVIDGCGSTVSLGATLGFTGAVITTQPADQNVSPGDAAAFFVTATGTGPITYLWRFNGVPIFPAETSNLLIINDAQVSDVGLYDCVATDVCGPGISATALLSCESMGKGWKNQARNLAIVQHPESSIICENGSHVLSVTAYGEGLSYVWRKDGIAIVPAETNSTLVLNPIVPGDQGTYDVIVSDITGSLLSSPAVLDVDAGPTITSHPANVSTPVGGSASFSVSASGDPTLLYQWRKGGLIGPLFDIPGSTETTHDIPVVNNTHAGRYQARVTNHCGSVLSNTAKLTLIL
jgi:hypothetical protein